MWKFSFFSYFLVSFLTISCVSALPTNAVAQTPKPKLVEIILNEETNDLSVRKIAKKLNPDLFYIDTQYMDGGKNTKHYARYLPLDDKNKTRFIAATVTDAGYFCTRYGCPTYVYQKIGDDNKWKLVLSVQSHNIYQDLNTKGDGPDNLITISQESGKRKVSVWLWDGQSFKEATKK